MGVFEILGIFFLGAILFHVITGTIYFLIHG